MIWLLVVFVVLVLVVKDFASIGKRRGKGPYYPFHRHVYDKDPFPSPPVKRDNTKNLL